MLLAVGSSKDVAEGIMPTERRAGESLHSLFEERVHEAPDRPALECEGRHFTYGALNYEANRIAHYLRDVSGIRADERVAILMQHPQRSIVAILAALKAGGAYVVLDPDDPPAVIRRILDDARPRAVLLDSSQAVNLTFFDGDMLVMDVMGDELDMSETAPESATTPSDLAYVVYTSGTTGSPKGVAVEHGSIVNTVTWRNRYYGLGPGDVTLSIPRPSFDSSVEDVFCTLTSGGCLLLPERDRITDRRYVVDLIARRGASHFIITPALYKRLLRGLDESGAASLSAVTIAGEWFTPSLVHEHYQRLPHVRLYNEYGPAENAVCSTVHPLSASDDRVLIGRPIDNTTAFVLGATGKPVGPGEVGELYLSGVGLARGYLNNPGLTDERFLHWPSPSGTIRVYRSGDMVRVCESGDLQFVGRQDRQVKIRGRRVELDHVAECLGKEDAVDDVFVLHHAEPSAPPHLIAFVVGPAAADIERLHVLAREHLPSYMRPTAIITVESIPVTGNGKVDEAALLKKYVHAVGEDAELGPVSAVEAVLLSIWRRMFPQIGVGRDDDFFELGGDSLAVMDLVESAEDELGVRMNAVDVYVSRTVGNLARLIESRRIQTTEMS
jgi:amino acid adenylation domain-containing protein